MIEAAEIGAEISNAPKVKVEIEEELRDPSVPYIIGLSPQGYGNLLRDLGASDEFISDVTVRLVKEPKTKRGFTGGHSVKNKTLTIYTDPLWQKYEQAMKDAKKISEGKNIRGNPFKGILHGTRMKGYLRNAPPERALVFAQRLVSHGIQREALAVALHESSHAVDYLDRHAMLKHRIKSGITAGSSYLGTNFLMSQVVPESAQAVATGFGVFIGIYSGLAYVFYFNPSERRARRFEKSGVYNSSYSDLVVFSPKSSQSNSVGENHISNEVRKMSG